MKGESLEKRKKKTSKGELGNWRERLNKKKDEDKKRDITLKEVLAERRGGGTPGGMGGEGRGRGFEGRKKKQRAEKPSLKGQRRRR